MLELARSQRLAREVEAQIGLLAAQVIKLRKEAEASRLEALALDKELQISQLLSKLDLDYSGSQQDKSYPNQDNPPPLEEISQQQPSQPSNPRSDRQVVPKCNKPHSNPRDNQVRQGHQQGRRQRGHSNPRGHQGRQRDRQEEGRQQVDPLEARRRHQQRSQRGKQRVQYRTLPMGL
jgi:hypothetical protein